MTTRLGEAPDFGLREPAWDVARLHAVLKLSGKSCEVHGEHERGAVAESALLKGFQVNVDDVWRAASRA